MDRNKLVKKATIYMAIFFDCDGFFRKDDDTKKNNLELNN